MVVEVRSEADHRDYEASQPSQRASDPASLNRAPKQRSGPRRTTATTRRASQPASERERASERGSQRAGPKDIENGGPSETDHRDYEASERASQRASERARICGLSGSLIRPRAAASRAGVNKPGHGSLPGPLFRPCRAPAPAPEAAALALFRVDSI